MNHRSVQRLLLGVYCAGMTTAATGFPLDSMLARGDSCLAVEWTPDSANTRSEWYIQNGSRCSGSDTVYLHSDFEAGTTYLGIAYSYGGEDSYHVFRDKVARGFLVGSHLCHYLSFGDPSDVIAGTDCSGFVCYLWNVPRTSTNGLASDPHYMVIDKSVLEPGDILVKAASHTVFIVEQDTATHYLAWESSSAVNGCRERIIDISTEEWDAYIALRNPDMVRREMEIAGRRSSQNPLLKWSVSVLRRTHNVYLDLEQPFSGHCLLYTLTGRTVLKENIAANGSTISFTIQPSLPAGIYLVSLVRCNGPQGHDQCTAAR
jgi:hypothetical protein